MRPPWGWVFDGPEQPLRAVEFDWPRLGAGEALVRVTAATLCGSDLHTRHGRRPTPVPTILGHETAGEVIAVGEPAPRYLDGTAVGVGERLTWGLCASCGECRYCHSGLPQKCDRLFKYGHAALTSEWGLSGGLATHVHLRGGSALVALPAGLPDELGAAAACAGGTVAGALRLAGDLAGRRLLLFGAGMLGLLASAMAADAGAVVIVVEPDEARREQVARFGASQALAAVTSDLPDWADVAIDFSGHPTAVAASLALPRLGGQTIWVGAVFPAPPLEVSAEQLVRRCRRLDGLHNYHPSDLATAVDYLAQRDRHWGFSRLLGPVLPLAAAPGAFDCRGAVRPLIAG
ncbi:MAG: alcohol dehydrogenase catalytic domain-containing protein [Fimbriimonadaceae bacterium]|nr:alcohol dehydrogenase catalytic domain-containing protein [Fimbriimonadaceae bacterium]